MFQVPVSPDNRALAASVNGRINAERAMVAAKALMWRLGAVGVLLLLAGAGLAAAFYGWSFVADSRTSYQKMAAAFTEALEHATIGGVKLIVPDKEIKLDASNATVRLDSAAIVRLDPAARVAISNPEIFRPTERQLGGENQTQPGKVVTNFTVFKSVTFGSGAVDTGWNYDSSDQNAPSSQYCYYIQPRDGGDVRVSVAKDGHLIPNNLGAVFGLNDRLAAANCVWFNGQPTSF